MPPLQGRQPLKDLPFDILGLIQILLDPTDIISLRLTCKQIKSSTTAHSVWQQVLLRVCREHGAFVPTFDLKRMTQVQLEDAALSPFRFASVLTKDSDEPCKPLATRILDLHGSIVENIRLIPGGRFLLTKMRDLTLHIWDLGCSAASVIKYTPIATYVPPPDTRSYEMISNHPTINDESCFYVFLLRQMDASASQLSVLSVNPVASMPTFSQFRTLDLTPQSASPNLNATAVSLNLCVFQYASTFQMVVWDYILDRVVASWYIVYCALQITISLDCIVTYTEEGMCQTWELSELLTSPEDVTHNLEPGFDYPEPPVLPRFNFYIGHNQQSCLDVFVFWPTWPRGRGRQNPMAVLVKTDGTIPGLLLNCYLMESFLGRSLQARSITIPCLKSTTILGSDHIGTCLLSGRFAGKWFVQPYQTVKDPNFDSLEGDVFFAVLDPTDWKMKHNCKAAFGRVDAYCAMSGRVCTIADGAKLIQVMDFIVPRST